MFAANFNSNFNFKDWKEIKGKEYALRFNKPLHKATLLLPRMAKLTGNMEVSDVNTLHKPNDEAKDSAFFFIRGNKLIGYLDTYAHPTTYVDIVIHNGAGKYYGWGRHQWYNWSTGSGDYHYAFYNEAGLIYKVTNPRPYANAWNTCKFLAEVCGGCCTLGIKWSGPLAFERKETHFGEFSSFNRVELFGDDTHLSGSTAYGDAYFSIRRKGQFFLVAGW